MGITSSTEFLRSLEITVSNRLASAILALFIFVTSGMIAARSYYTLVVEEGDALTIVRGIALGVNRKVIVNSPTARTCSGEIVLDLTDADQQFQIDIKGWFGFESQGKRWIQELSGLLAFNPLGQLGSSVIYIPVGKHRLRLGTLNINPVTIVFAIEREPSPELKFTQKIPGPFELRRDGTHVYRLMGPPIINTISSSGINFSAIPSSSLSISANPDLPCTRENATYVQVDDLIGKFNVIRLNLDKILSFL